MTVQDDSPSIENLLANNVAWARRVEADKPGFFKGLASQQAPHYLWIGCSDSRVPANEVVGLAPGELFVHRNVANLVQLADLNCLAVTQFAIEVLKVSHILICGHYGCGGVRAALLGQRIGLAEHWIRPLRSLAEEYRAELDALPDEEARVTRLCELNVLRQTRNLLHTQVVQDTWERGQPLAIHPVIYGLKDGLLHQLSEPITSHAQGMTLLHAGHGVD
ncbi:MAG TPA: carbonic anhydrase [Alphaproteobacteria bacterium]|nr:carbonic anhydrase [Alphaproteobacteria bacterium]